MANSIDPILNQTPIFSGLSPDQLGQIRNILVTKRFTKGEIIFSENENAVGFYIIMAGQVKVYKASADGKEQILHIFGPGDPFGEVPVFSGQSYPANAQALSKSELLFFSRKNFLELITKNPSLAMNMLAVLSMRLRQFANVIENLSLKEVPGRLAAYLLYLSEDQGNKDTVKLKISKGHLASLLGTIPETLSRIFSKMSEQNLIHVKGSDIEIIDREEMIRLAEEGRH